MVKFAADNRYGDKGTIVTHAGASMRAVAANRLSEVASLVDEYQVIGIDEGQFFEDIDQFCERIASLGKIVIVSSLQGTFHREAFPAILNLIPKCEKIKKLSAVCKLCKQKASFTFRTASKEVQSLIGGADMYMPLCRECHLKETRKNADDAFRGDPTDISIHLDQDSLAKPKSPESKICAAKQGLDHIEGSASSGSTDIHTNGSPQQALFD